MINAAKSRNLREHVRALPATMTLTLPAEKPVRLAELRLVPLYGIRNLTNMTQIGIGFPLHFRIEIADGDKPWQQVFETREGTFSFTLRCRVRHENGVRSEGLLEA
jgi:hypothetical protein